MDDHVGAEPALVGVGRDLLVEIAVRDHPGHLDHPAQLHFAPTTSASAASGARSRDCGSPSAAVRGRDAAAPPSRSTPRRRPCAPPRSAAVPARSGPASRSAGRSSWEMACWRWLRSPCAAVWTWLSFVSARARNCSLFFCSASADSSAKVPTICWRSSCARDRSSSVDRLRRSSSEAVTARAVSAAAAAAVASCNWAVNWSDAAWASARRASAVRACAWQSGVARRDARPVPAPDQPTDR